MIGLFDHVQSNKLQVFRKTEKYGTGASHVVVVSQSFILDCSTAHSLPQTLYLRLENSAFEKENLLLLLTTGVTSLTKGVFKQVELFIFRITHTHENTD